MRVRHDPLRGGFLLLMMIAFASIILGLATTFFFYCRRSAEDGNLALKIAQQRIALNSALAYVLQCVYPVAPVNATSPVSGYFQTTAQIFPLTVGDDPRTQRMGWYRLVLSDSEYQVTGFAPTMTYDLVPAPTAPPGPPYISLTVTAGVGPSLGAQTPVDPRDWQFELRSWYRINVQNPGTPTATISTITPLATPPYTW